MSRRAAQLASMRGRRDLDKHDAASARLLVQWACPHYARAHRPITTGRIVLQCEPKHATPWVQKGLTCLEAAVDVLAAALPRLQPARKRYARTIVWYPPPARCP